MKTVNKSVLIWYSPQEMYALVTAVERYPEFLPWCNQARVLQQHADGVTAEIGMAFAGLHHSFITRNLHVPDQRLTMQLVSGPFSHLDGQWDFLPVANGLQRACKVTLELHYGFGNPVLAKLVGPVFDRIANSLVEAFVQRAQQVYGD